MVWAWSHCSLLLCLVDVPRRPALFQEQVEGELDLRERGGRGVILGGGKGRDTLVGT